MKVSAEDFVRAWQLSSSVTEVVEKLGISKSAILNRAATFRRNGVVLKSMLNRHGWEAMTALAASLSGEHEEQPPADSSAPTQKGG